MEGWASGDCGADFGGEMGVEFNEGGVGEY